jgi:4-alpha-glucanotransferase
LKSEETLEHKKFFNFCKQEHEWLEDFSLFMALKEEYQGVAWSQWPKELARRETNALNGAKKRLEEAMLQHQFFQYLFFSQWKAVRAYSNQQGIQILGDLPLFPSYDSVEVWTHPEIFYLNEERAMTVLAGVPPDYFSEEGQLWGNPLYRWEVLKETRYEWWKKRIQGSLRLFDLLRLDHFRGFESYWEIPATAKTAKEGRWIAGPKEDFFSSLEESYGPLPFIAEDLGIIPKEVERLREMFGIPGMKILQFAFNGTAKHPYLPHHFEKNCVVYTGTHDNSPLAQWWSSCQESEQEFVLKYLGKSSLLQIHWEFIRLAMMSSAHFALFPLQDILGLGEEARMNTPGKAENNWTWRFQADQVSTEVVQRLSLLTKTSGRD